MELLKRKNTVPDNVARPKQTIPSTMQTPCRCCCVHYWHGYRVCGQWCALFLGLQQQIPSRAKCPRHHVVLRMLCAALGLHVCLDKTPLTTNAEIRRCTILKRTVSLSRKLLSTCRPVQTLFNWSTSAHASLATAILGRAKIFCGVDNSCTSFCFACLARLFGTVPTALDAFCPESGTGCGAMQRST